MATEIPNFFLFGICLFAAVTLTILIRTLILTRRARRLALLYQEGSEDAAGGGSSGRVRGTGARAAKPVLHEVKVDVEEGAKQQRQGSGYGWEKIMPVSLSISLPTPISSSSPHATPPATAPPPPRRPTDASPIFRDPLHAIGLVHAPPQRSRNRSPVPHPPLDTPLPPPRPTPAPTPSNPIPSSSRPLSPAPPPADTRAFLSVLVALPTRPEEQAKHADDDEEQEVPDVVIGCAQVLLRGREGEEEELRALLLEWDGRSPSG